jgi:hypothetical protein
MNSCPLRCNQAKTENNNHNSSCFLQHSELPAALAAAGSITTTTNQAYASPLDEVLDGEGDLVIPACGRDNN